VSHVARAYKGKSGCASAGPPGLDHTASPNPALRCASCRATHSRRSAARKAVASLPAAGEPPHSQREPRLTLSDGRLDSVGKSRGGSRHGAQAETLQRSLRHGRNAALPPVRSSAGHRWQAIWPRTPPSSPCNAPGLPCPSRGPSRTACSRQTAAPHRKCCNS
jgi:hypothetical protein